jgi:hypothetical protein
VTVSNWSVDKGKIGFIKVSMMNSTCLPIFSISTSREATRLIGQRDGNGGGGGVRRGGEK